MTVNKLSNYKPRLSTEIISQILHFAMHISHRVSLAGRMKSDISLRTRILCNNLGIESERSSRPAVLRPETLQNATVT